MDLGPKDYPTPENKDDTEAERALDQERDEEELTEGFDEDNLEIEDDEIPF